MQPRHTLSELTERQCEALTSFKEKDRILPTPKMRFRCSNNVRCTKLKTDACTVTDTPYVYGGDSGTGLSASFALFNSK